MKYKNKYKTFQYCTGSLKYLRFKGAIRRVILDIVGFLLDKNMNKTTILLYKMLYKIIPISRLKEFHINDGYIIIDGEFRGEKFGDAIKKCTTLCMLYVEEKRDNKGHRICILPKGEKNDACYAIDKIDFEIIK